MLENATVAVPALLSLDSVVALLTLTSLEIVLGIDNIVFIAILTGRLPAERQRTARLVGLSLAMAMRIILLFGIVWVMGLTAPLFDVPYLTEQTTAGVTAPLSLSGRDLILVIGGLFLIAKATIEIHHLVEQGHGDDTQVAGGTATVGAVLAQIALLDIVFSLDSVITAVGMAQQIEVMVAAIVIAVLTMMLFAEPVSAFVARHPSVKTLALAFLVMIGVLLVADGLGQHLPRGYVYFAMIFSLAVELINLRTRSRTGIAAGPTV
jgi:predicted tellurium resistance membrane protein TerC